MPDDKTTRLPPGYRLDLVDDSSVIVMRRGNGTLVARFTHYADPQEIRRSAEEDRRLQSKDGRHD
jgi:hypothetical protein